MTIDDGKDEGERNMRVISPKRETAFTANWKNATTTRTTTCMISSVSNPSSSVLFLPES